MARTKGSRNKKTIVTLVTVEEKLAAERANRDKLAAEQISITEEIKNLRERLKETKKALHASEKSVTVLEARKEEVAAIEEEKAKKEELERVVNALVSSGKSMDEILERIKD